MDITLVKMKVSIIVAIAENFAIGKNNDLLWHLPKDMRFFKETTQGHCIITGRKNYFSIPEKYRPLADRTNIIITRNRNLKAENTIIVNAIQEALKKAEELGESEVFIIGGGEIYKQSINLADTMYVTHVETVFDDADTFFPKYSLEEWKEVHRENHLKDEKHKYNFSFVKYERI